MASFWTVADGTTDKAPIFLADNTFLEKGEDGKEQRDEREREEWGENRGE